MPEIEEPSPEEFEKEITEAKPRGILYERAHTRDLVAPVMLVGLCVVLSSLFWFSPKYGSYLWVSRDSVFVGHEYWRLFTALFVHSGMEHLLSNLPLFFVFGFLLRAHFGLWAFPFATVLAGVISNLSTLYFYPGPVRLIGASGMVYAVVALWIRFYLKYELRYSFWQKMLRVVGVLLVLLFPTSFSPTTSYLAHVFGFIYGILAAGVLIYTGIYDKKHSGSVHGRIID